MPDVSNSTIAEQRINQLLAAAQEALNSVRLPEAISYYRAILAIEPSHALSNYWLGVLRLKAGVPQEAINHLEVAVRTEPHVPDFHIDLGLAYETAGQIQRAQNSYEEARRFCPSYGAAQLSLAEQFERAGKLDEAIEACRRGLLVFRDDFPLLRKCAGLQLRQGRWPESLKTWRRILVLRPNCAFTHTEFGNDAFKAGQFELATNAFERALELQPTALVARVNLGLSRQKLRQFDGALECFRRALQIDPQNSDLHKGIGDIHRDLEQWADANAAWQRAVDLRPDYAEAWQNLGLGLERQDRLEEALACHQRVVQLRPQNAVDFRYLGMVYQDLGRLKEAGECYEGALRLSPKDAEIHWQIFSLKASVGEFPEAWNEHEWRWGLKNRTTPKREFPQPTWDGSNLAGRTILLHCEQGFGDSIQAARYIPLVQDRGGRVLLWAPPPLVPLFQNFPGVSNVFSQLKPEHRFDVHLPMMSLPFVFQTRIETIPAKVPYLRAPADRSRRGDEAGQGDQQRNPPPDVGGDGRSRRGNEADQAISNEIRLLTSAATTPSNRPKVGLVWCGSRSQQHERRPIPVEHLKPMIELDGIDFYSLQTGSNVSDLQVLNAPDRVVDLSPQLNDFADTAAAIEQLDLVITVDTATAHLAGALGRPVWVLLSYAADWRWLLDREDCPWYPTMRLFRQSRSGGWKAVIERVCQELRHWTVRGHRNAFSGVRPSSSAETLKSDAGSEPSIAVKRAEIAAPEDGRTPLNTYTDWKTWLGQALVHHQAGRLAEAERLYLRILEQQPRQADALRFLGVVCRQNGNLERAREFLQKSLASDPKSAQAHHDLGLVWHDLGRFADATRAYQRALELQPEFPEALYNLGNAYYAAKSWNEAEACYRRALEQRPEMEQAHYNLGVLAQDRKDRTAALVHYGQAVKLRPDYIDALLNLAVVFKDAEQFGESEKFLRRILRIDPHHAEAKITLAGLLSIAEPIAAEVVAAEVVAADVVAADVRRRTEGESTMNPVPIRLLTSAATGDGKENLSTAEQLCLEALERQPSLVEGWLNLGVIRQRLGQVNSAIECFQHALELRPDHADARYNLGIAQLLNGQFEPGWQNYEARWQTANPIFAPRNFSKPLWQGEPLDGCTLLVHAEQGLGDTIQFARFLPQLGKYGGKIVFECPAPLRSLFGTMEGVTQIISRGQPLPSFDFHVPLMSLPHRLRCTYVFSGVRPSSGAETLKPNAALAPSIAPKRAEIAAPEDGRTPLNRYRCTLQSLPNRIPYLNVPKDVFVSLPSAGAARFRIGLVWAGNARHGTDKLRSLPLAGLTPILSLPGAAFYSLQVGPPRKELDDFAGTIQFHDLSPQLTDFGRTAAAIDQLDLVISVDTAVAHLAGALGKQVWVLLPFAPDWRWLLDREGSPWYPTARLFRQKHRGDWAEVVNIVAAEVTRRICDQASDKNPRGIVKPSNGVRF